ncbi:unnamed protein product [Penicillium camemberti]|uniref:Str. FM013 n=1 Tax=Penicillium camemberti (strain FM 013) TaxID=1429867 RepID=A0A0G4P7F4_PENC3|nr:unnamed protein product [Penicillium camemberti]
MYPNRLFQCRGDGLVYIQHLEFRILELESACSSRYPDTLGSQQQIGRQCRPCEVCRNPNIYQGLGGSREISADSIRLASESGDDNQSIASESCHDNQSSQHSRTPERAYTFIPYLPTASSVVKDSSTPTKPTQRKRNHLSLFTSLVSNLPESSDWKNWASINETQRKDIVFCLASGIAVPKNDSHIASDQPTTIPILLKKYATSMEPVEMKRTSAGSVANSPFACFKELLFCSLCAVALEVMPKEIVFQYMQSVFRCDAQSKSLRGRVRGAKWANRAIYLLSSTNWGSCSWDIIYIAGKRVNFYSEFNDYSIKPDELIKGLKPEFNPHDTQTISVPLAIPSIIRTIFRNLVPLEKICECLGYELSGYNKLDLSGLQKVLAEEINTEPSKKRKIGPSITPSKKRRRNSSPRLSESDPFETSPSESELCSPNDISSPTEGSLNSSGNYEVNGLLEEYSISISTPISNGITGSNDDRMDADNSDIQPPISKPSLRSIPSDVSLLQQPWNTTLSADINPSPPIESPCDHVTGDASRLQQPSNIALPADINPLPPIDLGQGVGTSMLDQILETLNSPYRQSCPTSRETTSLRDRETSRQGSPLSDTIYRSVSHPSLSTPNLSRARILTRYKK